jgi:hypothetical protein
VFVGDYNKSQWVPANRVERLPEPIRKLYQDYCLLRDSWYGCPVSFNALTPACYINHSDTPNVGFGKFFYTLRDIDVGEELLADYNAFSKLYQTKERGDDSCDHNTYDHRRNQRQPGQ